MPGRKRTHPRESKWADGRSFFLPDWKNWIRNTGADSLRRRADGGLLQTPGSLHCSHKCAIGQRYVPEVEVGELSNIILETIACLNEINPLTNRLIQIARDGKISDDEIKDFAFISQKLDEISLAVDSLNLWVDKTASENDLNVTLLREEKERLKKQK